MKVCSISSGSSGNCVYLETENTRILIDAGLSGKGIETRMKSAGLDPKRLDAIFVTHEHADHIHGCGVMSRRFRLPVFASEGTRAQMIRKPSQPDAKRIYALDKEAWFEFQDLMVYPFGAYHDAADPVGYVFSYKGEKVSVLTDTGIVDDRMFAAIENSDVYYLESNYDERMLEIGPYPRALKERIRSREGHLSNDQAGLLLTELLGGRNETVILAHLSEENNTPEICRETILMHLASAGIDGERDQRILVAGRHVPTEQIPARFAAAGVSF